MSDKAEGFRGRSIEDVQRDLFLRDLPTREGRWRYRKAGLSADPGTVVLFQFKARVIASAVFLRDEPFERPVRGSAGALYFEPASFRTFEPVDVAGMRKAWPRFRAFGHVKQFLNPEGYGAFVRGLKGGKGLKRPGRRRGGEAARAKP
jgi:hypothetical protein